MIGKNKGDWSAGEYDAPAEARTPIEWKALEHAYKCRISTLEASNATLQEQLELAQQIASRAQDFGEEKFQELIEQDLKVRELTEANATLTRELGKANQAYEESVALGSRWHDNAVRERERAVSAESQRDQLAGALRWAVETLREVDGNGIIELTWESRAKLDEYALLSTLPPVSPVFDPSNKITEGYEVTEESTIAAFERAWPGCSSTPGAVPPVSGDAKVHPERNPLLNTLRPDASAVDAKDKL